MRKIFLDCGAHCGCSVRKFRQETIDFEDYEIYCFEANHNLIPYLNKEPNITVIHKAVWSKDSQQQFFILGTQPICGGSTLFASKAKKARLIETVETDTVDLSGWIMSNFNKDDYIFLKMDIEGAEYSTLDKMVEDGSIEYIDRFEGEWHAHKIGMSTKITFDMIKKLKEYGLSSKEWNAINREKYGCIG